MALSFFSLMYFRAFLSFPHKTSTKPFCESSDVGVAEVFSPYFVVLLPSLHKTLTWTWWTLVDVDGCFSLPSARDISFYCCTILQENPSENHSMFMLFSSHSCRGLFSFDLDRTVLHNPVQNHSMLISRFQWAPVSSVGMIHYGS